MQEPGAGYNVPKLDIQGHRGARGLYPENTVTAFLEALKIGADTLEMDVVISSDHQVVVSHEPWMSDVICSEPGGRPVLPASAEKYNIYRMSYKEIRQFDCGSRGNSNFPLQKAMPESKPLLSEVIEKAEHYAGLHHLPPVLYNIETKCTPQTDNIFHPGPSVFLDLLYDVLKQKDVLGRVMIQSFDVRTLQFLKKKDPAVKISLLAEDTDGYKKHIEALGFKPDIYSPDFSLLDREAIENLHSDGIEVIPWTINEAEDMIRLAGMWIDGLITDYPDRAVKLFKR
jgi:glycerophosphoryl diester phosphodiesterase